MVDAVPSLAVHIDSHMAYEDTAYCMYLPLLQFSHGCLEEVFLYSTAAELLKTAYISLQNISLTSNLH